MQCAQWPLCWCLWCWVRGDRLSCCPCWLWMWIWSSFWLKCWASLSNIQATRVHLLRNSISRRSTLWNVTRGEFMGKYVNQSRADVIEIWPPPPLSPFSSIKSLTVRALEQESLGHQTPPPQYLSAPHPRHHSGMAVAGICWNSSHPAGRAMHPIQPALSALYSLSLSISSSSTCMEDGVGWGWGGQTWTHATSQPPPPTRGPHISLASRSSIASKSFALFKAGEPQLCVARHPTWSNSVVNGPLRRSLSITAESAVHSALACGRLLKPPVQTSRVFLDVPRLLTEAGAQLISSRDLNTKSTHKSLWGRSWAGGGRGLRRRSVVEHEPTWCWRWVGLECFSYCGVSWSDSKYRRYAASEAICSPQGEPEVCHCQI